MTGLKTRLFNLLRLFGISSAFLFAVWLALVVAAPAQTFHTLANFDGTNGAAPGSMYPVQGRDGNLYGTTRLGGNAPYCPSGCGTAFKITPVGMVSTIYDFCTLPGCDDGSLPNTGLILAADGNFYGTGPGGAHEYGTVFRITSDGTLTTLHSFCSQASCADGAQPEGGLLQATDGNFYGVTGIGGAYGWGTVFKITPTGKSTILYSFANGAYPIGGLVQASDGNLYGTTYGCGSPCGSVFKITASGKLTTLYAFGVEALPASPLIQGTDGNLYGTTSEGAVTNFDGTVFRITRTGKLTTLYTFCTQGICTDGATPWAGLIQATDGNLYGTTASGGNTALCGGQGCGTIFRITPAGTLTTLHSFNGDDGAGPGGGLLQATNGTLYGTTSSGGSQGGGTFYSLDVGLNPFVKLVTTQGKAGQVVEILGQGFTGTTSVMFGTGSASVITIVSDTYMTAKLPATATTGYVTVTTPSGTLTSSQAFKVLPAITSFTPTSGPVGTKVTITGSGFIGATKVTFGGVKAISYTVDSVTQITATVPPGAKTGNIAVTTPAGGAGKGTFSVI